MTTASNTDWLTESNEDYKKVVARAKGHQHPEENRLKQLIDQQIWEWARGNCLPMSPTYCKAKSSSTAHDGVITVEPNYKKGKVVPTDFQWYYCLTCDRHVEDLREHLRDQHLEVLVYRDADGYGHVQAIDFPSCYSPDGVLASFLQWILENQCRLRLRDLFETICRRVYGDEELTEERIQNDDILHYNQLLFSSLGELMEKGIIAEWRTPAPDQVISLMT
jgi:hypothetical protein